jgi:hypothetical protein
VRCAFKPLRHNWPSFSRLQKYQSATSILAATEQHAGEGGVFKKQQQQQQQHVNRAIHKEIKNQQQQQQRKSRKTQRDNTITNLTRGTDQQNHHHYEEQRRHEYPERQQSSVFKTSCLGWRSIQTNGRKKGKNKTKQPQILGSVLHTKLGAKRAAYPCL